ncbi:L-histidine N(alpha)-methyltransferase [Salinisphaera hydrothermalis]|uniref:L-histidine N(alpha)-methyltransferase n=1 Tax=Salinisphaera hydrothermalis TaxID=563188 RepID=UPI0005600336|nr:L-histidine N(alpha)-methyltransferase [Salinisphaera hydrothermalis]
MHRDASPVRLAHHRVAPERRVPDLAEDARAGLLAPPRSMPPKYFYDERGSRLFEAICDTPEYYPTRAEAALLTDVSERVIADIRPAHVVELGSGNSHKTRHLFAACERLGIHPRYWPFEVSPQIMLDSAAALIADYDWLHVEAMSGDYTAGLGNLPLPGDGGRRLILFLGGTIGNFEPAQADAFLAEIVSLMAPGDALLLGLDRVKDVATLEAAYDDAAGYTAAFNKNLINVINRELGGDMPVAGYRHRAVFDRTLSRIEMRLVAEYAHRVRLEALGADFEIAAGEEILTEISRKFSQEAITGLLGRAGLRQTAHYPYGDDQYSLVLAVRD